MLNRIFILAAMALSLTFPIHSFATTVQFQTSLGNFEVVLFDADTPQTTANFLAYIDTEAFEDSVVHRAIPNFVIQGGGFTYRDSPDLQSVQTNPSVINEPKYSNTRGTIAMAKRGNSPNSATSQWYINLKNNGLNGLDYDNGGYTVFGMVKGDGMAIVDAIAAIETYNAGSLTGIGAAGSNLPLIDFDPAQQQSIDADNFVLIYNVVTLNAEANTKDELSVQPQLIKPRTSQQTSSGKSGGSFNFGFIALLLLLFVAILVRRVKR